MLSEYSVVLIGGHNLIQIIDLNTTKSNAEMAFFSLYIAAIGSSYDEIYLYSGETQINKKTLKK